MILMTAQDANSVDPRLRDEERRKWDDFYGSLKPSEIDEATLAFCEGLADQIDQLLPAGGSVLEAGCGGGWQSLILAREGKHRVTLMDFSREALRYAARSFEENHLSADFVCQDVFAEGKPEFDLVFNAGVLEHYTLDQQAAFLRGMASRSRQFVLAIVPNRMCYWYWLWRLHHSGHGRWAFGKESPLDDLAPAFEKAGLRFLGQSYGGFQWADSFIESLEGIDAGLRDEILAVHRSPVIPQSQRAYLVAALGCKDATTLAPTGWTAASAGSADSTSSQLVASLADALAAVVAADHRHRQVENSLTKSQKQVDAQQETLQRRADEMADLRGQLAAARDCIAGLETLKRSRAYRLCIGLQRARHRLLPQGSVREAVARLAWRGAKAVRRPKQSLRRVATGVVNRLPRKAQDSVRRLRATVRDWRLRRNCPPTSVGVPGLVSVVLPVYNHADYVRGAIESVLAQTYEDFELIVVNDGSTDGVEQVLSPYLDDPRVRVLTQPNQGLPKALSNGFEFARGEFWTWTSADNRMGPDQLQRQVAYLQSHGEAAMVYADYVVMDSAGKPLDDPTFRPQNRRSPNDPEIHLPEGRGFGQSCDNFIGPCFLYRGWIGRLLGEYDPIQGIEDFDYWLRLGLVGRIDHLDSDQPLYEYRVHENTLSARAAELKIQENAQQLMAYHRRRREFFARPWTIHADAATQAWLGRIHVGPHRVVAWNGEPIRNEAAEKHLLLVHAESLARAADGQRESGPSDAPAKTDRVVTAAWFPGRGDTAERYRAEMPAGADVCFAENELTVSRLSLLTPDVFLAARGRAMLDLAIQWGNHRLYYRTTRPADQRVRTLPRVVRRQGNRPHVLLQADSFTQGGLEQVVLDLAESLRDDDFDVSLLVLGRQGQDADRMRQAGVPVLDLPAENREEHYGRLLAERGINLVSAHYSLFGASIAAARRIPFVQTIHNMYFVLPPEMAAAYRANDPATSAYVCVSQLAAHCAETVLGLPISKMTLAPNGIDLDRLDAAAEGDARQSLRRELGFSDDDFVFLNVGAIQPNKCQPMLAYAMADVVRSQPKAKLAMVGRAVTEDYLDQLRRVITRHGLEKSAIVVGHRTDVLRFYWAADAFVLPSVCEGWSLALAEAVAAGLPAIASHVGSAPDLLPRVGGRLIDPPVNGLAGVDFSRLDLEDANNHASVAQLSAAMKDFCRQRPQRTMREDLRQAFDRRRAYRPYGELFLWLLQGGHPAAGRTWTAARMGSSPSEHSNKLAGVNCQTEPNKAVA